MSGWWHKAMRVHSLPWLRRLLGDERALSVVEFAAIAPFLGLLVVGVADLGRGYAARFALQNAANRTIELAHQGTKADDYTYLKTEAATAAGVAVTAVTLDQWLECDSGTKKAFTENCDAGQQSARYIKLTIVKNFDPLFSSAGYPNTTGGIVQLSANASLRVQ